MESENIRSEYFKKPFAKTSLVSKEKTDLIDPDIDIEQDSHLLNGIYSEHNINAASIIISPFELNNSTDNTGIQHSKIELQIIDPEFSIIKGIEDSIARSWAIKESTATLLGRMDQLRCDNKELSRLYHTTLDRYKQLEISGVRLLNDLDPNAHERMPNAEEVGKSRAIKKIGKLATSFRDQIVGLKSEVGKLNDSQLLLITEHAIKVQDYDEKYSELHRKKCSVEEILKVELDAAISTSERHVYEIKGLVLTLESLQLQSAKEKEDSLRESRKIHDEYDVALKLIMLKSAQEKEDLNRENQKIQVDFDAALESLKLKNSRMTKDYSIEHKMRQEEFDAALKLSQSQNFQDKQESNCANKKITDEFDAFKVNTDRCLASFQQKITEKENAISESELKISAGEIYLRSLQSK